MISSQEDDDARHKREQDKLRAKRKSRPVSESQRLRERQRKEHIQKTLAKQNTHHASSSSSASQTSPFQSLFSKRAQGFLVEIKFRNAPPRPPVGPVFVGYDPENELRKKWSQYRPGNAIELHHTWKLHSEHDLGVPLGRFAMDLEGCYNQKRVKDLEADGGNNGFSMKDTQKLLRNGVMKLHPRDEEILNWTGSMGDTAAEELKIRRERTRANAARGLDGSAEVPTTTPSKGRHKIQIKKERNNGRKKGKSLVTSSGKKIAKHSRESRVLDEENPFFMKKTTYITNDLYRSVHNFKSGAIMKKKEAEEIDKMMITQKEKRNNTDTIEGMFDTASGGRQQRMKHPTKRGVTAVADYPLLPDVDMWGHIYTHVVMDNLPRGIVTTSAQLDASLIADVEMRENTSATGDGTRNSMMGHLLLPEKAEQVLNGDVMEGDEGIQYNEAQAYDLDVHPLKEADTPHSNFLIVMNPKTGKATYRPVSSRVQLSTGRPARKRRPATIVERRGMKKSEIAHVEKQVAEIDHDLAQKHGVKQ